MDFHPLFTELKQHFPESEILENHPLAAYTTVRLGGPADIFIHTKTATEFIDILKYLSGEGNVFFERSERAGEAKPEGNEAQKKPLPNLTILGNGSNVLISDSGIRGVVIKNSSSAVEYLADSQIKADSGVQLPFLINDTIRHSLSGLEQFAYIPSSVGGAVWDNIHGVNKDNFDKFLASLTAFDLNTGLVTDLKPADLSWGYDFSSLQNQKKLVILSAVLQLSPGTPAVSQKLVADIIAKKILTQSMNSLGSTFKNPEGDAAGLPAKSAPLTAGRIIDQELHLKGFRLNQIQISPKHGNFILNLGGGTAADYYAVIQKIISEAKTKGFTLEPEIKFLGEFN